MVRQENNSIGYSGSQDLINVVWGGGGAPQPGTAPPRESATLHILIVHAQADKNAFTQSILFSSKATANSLLKIFYDWGRSVCTSVTDGPIVNIDN